jgi:hypothetical protein
VEKNDGVSDAILRKEGTPPLPTALENAAPSLPANQWEYWHEELHHDTLLVVAVDAKRTGTRRCCWCVPEPSTRDVWDVHKSIVSVSPVVITDTTQRGVIIQRERY